MKAVAFDYSRTLSFFAADFKPSLAILDKVYSAAHQIERIVEATDWATGPHLAVVRKPAALRLYQVSPQRVSGQSLGGDFWNGDGNKALQAIKECLKALGIDRLTRIGFKTLCFVPMQMAHPELVELMFGSYLPKVSQISGLIGKPDDTLVHLEGKYSGNRIKLIVSPQKASQVITAFNAVGNLEQMAESKYFDAKLMKFKDSINEDCLSVDVDAYLEDISVESLEAFAESSQASAAAITTSAINQLKSIPQIGVSK